MVAKENVAPSGGILADDMGLGKTATVIALILKSKEKKYMPAASNDGSDSSDEESVPDSGSNSAGGKPKGGTLIICTLTLIDHWEQEIIKHVDSQGLSVAKHHGASRNKDPQKLAKLSDVVITTYGVVRQEANKGPLFKMSWERVIVDEAHEVRNPESLGCKTVSSLEADHRWCVTGTPVHNSLLDLHGLYKVLNWKPFSERDRWDTYFGVDDLSNRPLWELLKRASIKRRTKKEYGDGSSRMLPKRVEEYIFVDMDPNEREAYENVAQFSKSMTDIPENLVQLRTLREGQEANRRNKKYMYCVLLLRQLCNHPSLLKEENINEDLDFDEPEVVYDSREDEALDQTRQSGKSVQIQNEWIGTKKDLQKYCNFEEEIFSDQRPSTKMEKMLEILQHKVLPCDDKAVIVSQWTKMLDIISTFLDQNTILHKKISGTVPSQDRADIVRAFNDSSSGLKVLLLSLKAGGVGLNLVGGNHLILYDLHWNPQLEAQACDRIYRMGQEKDVFIYKFILRDTIEEVIRKRQEEKLDLAQTVLDNPSARSIRKMTTLGENDDDIANILRDEARRGRKRSAQE